jgi:hypothetical protein
MVPTYCFGPSSSRYMARQRPEDFGTYRRGIFGFAVRLPLYLSADKLDE